MSSAYQSPYPHSRHRIFNHDILSCTHEDVAGNHLYSGRALGMTEPDDVIQIHPFLKREWKYITRHYQNIALPYAQQVIWDVSLKRLQDFPDRQESLFYFGPRENGIRPQQRYYRVVEHINNKNNFVALASHLRMDIPATKCFQGKEWFAGLDHFEYPCYVKAAVSVAGKGIFRCENAQQVIQALAHFDDNVPLQVQEEISTQVFLNLQYTADEQGVTPLLASEQVLNGFTHQGNRYPACCEPWESVDPMAEWLWEKGMRGIFAFDVGVVRQDGETRYVPIECNPRFNGASYPSAIAQRMGIRQWIAKELKTRAGTLGDIDLDGLEYDAATGKGIIVVNWGTVLIGKIAVLIAGNPQQQADLEAQLRKRL
ncbi:MAG: ATP-grasp domain-containing protein [Chromatiales bacterium]|nr:ATP-grasp domain-containing protein [Chromatiales bacterium]